MAASKLPNLFNVNLLINRAEKIKFTTRLLKWALSSGKFIVIFIEIITISAFVYRYKLDADLADIQDQINDKISYINTLKSDEILLRNTQFQINNIIKLKKEKVDLISPLNELTKILPRDVIITNLSFDRNQAYPKTSLSITGKTPSNLELSVLIKELQKNPIFSDINLTNVSFETQTIFTITGNLNSKTGG